MRDYRQGIRDHSKSITGRIIKDHEYLVDLYKNKDEIIDDYYFENLKYTCRNIITKINNMEYLENKLCRLDSYKEAK